ncbi:MAG: hypothetical protein N4A50_14165 [Vallitalea sp.]|jgi:protective antigen|nr:hypothetical protein [Vallitalea sp.]
MFKKIGMIIAVLSFIIAIPYVSYAEDGNVQEDSYKQGHGLLGYLFEDVNYQKNTVIKRVHNGNLVIYKNSLNEYFWEAKSAYWKGVIVPSISGEYKIYTSDYGEGTLIKINSKILENNEIIHLDEDVEYNVSISQIIQPKEDDTIVDSKLFWERPDNVKEIIPNDNLKLPFIKESKPLNPEVEVSPAELGADYNREKRSLSYEDGASDTDGDHISDYLERSGYTTSSHDLTVTLWVEALHEGQPRYVSSPYKWSTDDDPYSDFQEVVGLQMDPNVTGVAKHPLVAAFPDISVLTDNFIISMNKNVTASNASSSSRTVSRGTSNSSTVSSSMTVSASMTEHVSLMNAGVSATESYSATQSNSNTSSYSQSSSGSYGSQWSKSMSMNSGEAAFFTINAKYKNIGTAPIYKANPTISMILNDKALLSIQLRDSQRPENLLPNKEYPQGGSHLAINTMDDFGSSRITLNEAQVDAMQRYGNFTLETLQLTGNVADFDRYGNVIVNQKKDWANYIAKINKTTAGIILDTRETGPIRRNIAAIDEDIFIERLHKPDVTLKEALKIAYSVEEKEDGLYYNNKKINDVMEIKIDKNTYDMLQKQSDVDDIFNASLRAGMNFYIKIYDRVPDRQKTKVKYMFIDNDKFCVQLEEEGKEDNYTQFINTITFISDDSYYSHILFKIPADPRNIYVSQDSIVDSEVDFIKPTDLDQESYEKKGSIYIQYGMSDYDTTDISMDFERDYSKPLKYALENYSINGKKPSEVTYNDTDERFHYTGDWYDMDDTLGHGNYLENQFKAAYDNKASVDFTFEGIKADYFTALSPSEQLAVWDAKAIVTIDGKSFTIPKGMHSGHLFSTPILPYGKHSVKVELSYESDSELLLRLDAVKIYK